MKEVTTALTCAPYPGPSISSGKTNLHKGLVCGRTAHVWPYLCFDDVTNHQVFSRIALQSCHIGLFEARIEKFGWLSSPPVGLYLAFNTPI